MTNLISVAQRLDEAARTRHAIPQISAGQSLSVADSYAVQRMLLERHFERGERLAGIKLGFTSRAKMQQMGVDDLIWGRLTDAMIVEEGGELDLTRFIHPRAEPEVAFLLGERLTGSVTAAQAFAAVAAVAPAIEIIDSRYADFRFNLADVIADNCSSAAFVVGSWQQRVCDVGNLGVLLELDGEGVQYASTAAVLGHPVRALVAAARLVATAGLALEPGSIVLTGAITAAEALRPGMHVRATMEQLGTVALRTSAAH
ncbi:MAG TPA: fumarylacetoacetate hydrolase family protein [Steroidobacteraceae bacterium]|nr:fumarylacetoacetate hydrolase family protein [Steroidobacteraceae bacterium]HRX89516.1 fumarylacetoacetate hydrolase family protein [Steroidobacteraceae bacterium]